MVKKGLLTKKVNFQGKEITMYSIDGVTWSTRPDELEQIIERHTLQQAGVSADLKGEDKVAVPKPKPKKFTRVHDDSELDEVIEEDSGEEDPDVEIDDDVDIDEVISSKKSKVKSSAPIKNAKISKPIKVKPKAVAVKKSPAKKVADKKPAKKAGAKAKPAPKAKANVKANKTKVKKKK